jgi:hypothetical protein
MTSIDDRRDEASGEIAGDASGALMARQDV